MKNLSKALRAAWPDDPIESLSLVGAELQHLPEDQAIAIVRRMVLERRKPLAGFARMYACTKCEDGFVERDVVRSVRGVRRRYVIVEACTCRSRSSRTNSRDERQAQIQYDADPQAPDTAFAKSIESRLNGGGGEAA